MKLNLSRMVLAYISPNRTTHCIAQKIKEEMERRSYRVETFDLGSDEVRKNPKPLFTSLLEADLTGWGSPVYHLDMLPPVYDFLKRFIGFLKDTDETVPKIPTFFFVNFGGITTGKALMNAGMKFSSTVFKPVAAVKITAPHFHHPGSFPSAEVLDLIRKFCCGLESGEYSPINPKKMRKIFSPAKRRISFIYPFVHLVGKFRELPIRFNSEKCRRCSLCVRQCPTGALSFADQTSNQKESRSNPNNKPVIFRNRQECIHCYHCIVACPIGAVLSPVEKLDNMIRLNKRIVGTEKPSNGIFSLREPLKEQGGICNDF